MLKVAVAVFALVAVCYAQPPLKPPMIPETFMTEIDVHIAEHGRERLMGKGKWERDEMKMAATRSVEFKEWKDNVTFTDMHLEKFDTKMAYDVEMNSTGTYCMKHAIKLPSMPKVWEWLQKATGDRHMDPRSKMEVDRWTLRLEDGNDIVLFVADDKPNVPLALFSFGRHGAEEVRFTSFVAMAPPSSDFDPPPSCA
ncbi:uncharacterized protein LOC135339809 isoform X1 [Halichondria panicea]|uniref:uncharacterized protein LOC135339809 isoform X1 n=1 Tax=Halichondria panicea TaxID=6063 RepID=UPI00312B2B27